MIESQTVLLQIAQMRANDHPYVSWGHFEECSKCLSRSNKDNRKSKKTHSYHIAFFDLPKFTLEQMVGTAHFVIWEHPGTFHYVSMFFYHQSFAVARLMELGR